jgi:hypothetical protein
LVGVLERIESLLGGLSPKKAADLDRLLAAELARPWLPTPGPQLEAYLSEADLLLFGGSAGGGKTDLLCGLALTEHHRTVVFRQQSNALNGFWDRLMMLVPNPASKNGSLKSLTTTDGRKIECGHLEAPGAENSWQGRPHDFIGIDEGAQISSYKVNFVLGWLRSADGRRCRAVIASNPPIGGEGAYLLEWFAPWLDPFFTNPAQPGELRWALTVGDANELKTVWVDGPDPVWLSDDGSWRLATDAEITAEPRLKAVNKPLSRTFIPSRLDDNPYLKDTGYRARLNSLPEPLRSQLLYGDFLAGREDDEWQVIPSEWVRIAQRRWIEPRGKRMKALGVDVAQGGADATTIAALYEPATFDKIATWPGKTTPDGPSVANLILNQRKDGAAIAIDTTGGWGGSARDHLWTHHQIKITPIVFSAAGDGGDASTRLAYANLRAKMYWEFRVALDPAKSGNVDHEDVCLPPGDRILAQLTAARWKPRSGRIVIESKEDIRDRLGSSPDEADAIVQAWHVRNMIYRQRMRRDREVATLGAGARTAWLG